MVLLLHTTVFITGMEEYLMVITVLLTIGGEMDILREALTAIVADQKDMVTTDKPKAPEGAFILQVRCLSSSMQSIRYLLIESVLLLNISQYFQHALSRLLFGIQPVD